MDLKLTEEFLPLSQMVWWSEIKAFLKEKFKDQVITDASELEDPYEQLTVWAPDGKSKLIWAPLVEPDMNQPDMDQPGMYWECDCWELDVFVNPANGRVEYQKQWMWCINDVPRKEIPFQDTPMTWNPLSVDLWSPRNFSIRNQALTESQENELWSQEETKKRSILDDDLPF